MSIAVAMCFALLVVDAVGEMESSTQRNTATVRKWEEVVQKMNFNLADTEKLAGLSAELASMTAPKMACAIAPGTMAGVDLKDISISDCMTAMASKMVGLRPIRSEIISLAIDPTSGGKTILTEWQNVAEAMTSTGAVVPHSRLSFRDMMRFDFDDEGLIVGMTSIGDDGVVDTIQQSPAKRNVATTMKIGEAFQKMNGVVLTPEVYVGVWKEVASLIAPKIECSWAPGTKNGFVIKDVSVEDCMTAMASTCPQCQAKVVSQEILSIAIDPNNGGKTIISEWQNVVDISGTRLSYPDVLRLDFDDEGLVVAWTLIGDDGVFANFQGEVQALAGRTTHWFLVVFGAAIGLVVFGVAMGAWAVDRRGYCVGEPTLLG